MKIAFIGLPCSGKTTLAREVAKRLKCTFVPEVARILIESMGRKPKKEDQDFIMRMQIHLENSLFGDVKVCDVPVFLNHIYYRLYFGEDDNSWELLRLAECQKYDIVFRLSQLPYTEDGIRYQTKEEMEQIENMIDEYEHFFTKTINIRETNLKKRVDIVLEHIHETISRTSA